MKVICQFCGKPVSEVPPKDDPKVIKGACDGCYVERMDLKYLDKQIRESGDNPPDEK